MSFFQLRTVPSHRWPALPDAAFARAWNAYLDLDRTQWLSPAELEEGQLRQVRTVLTHSIRNVPYYREALSAAGIVPEAIRTMDDFRRVPLLPRRTYQEHVSTKPATVLPAGTVATGTKQTSGSSGTPTTILFTNMTALWWHAFYLRDLEWCGLDPSASMAEIRSTRKTGSDFERARAGETFPCWSSQLDPLLQTGPFHVMDFHQHPRRQLQWLRQVAPAYLMSYPTNLEALACLIRDDGPLPSLRVLQSFSATLTPEAQSFIERIFGVPVKNSYSCQEMGYLTSPCPEENSHHIHAENVLLEVLDAQGKPCPPGTVGGVYVTHLHNLRAPFLRYELGDQAAFDPTPCPCGRGLPCLMNILGKSYPIFPLPDGREKPASMIAVKLRQMGGHWQHQVVQKALDHVVVRLAAQPTWTAQHTEELRSYLREFFEAPIRIDIEFHERLEQPASGKFQSLICEVKRGS